jgi:uncharacterized membrane-anchored protein
MKNTLANIFLFSLLSMLSLAAASEEAQAERSCEQVEDMLKSDFSPADVVTAMVDSGMALPEATVFAMKCAAAQYREAIGAAGVGLANSIAGAESVVWAVADVYGEYAPETEAARDALQQYKKMERQPTIYNGDTKPTGGGGVSPS